MGYDSTSRLRSKLDRAKGKRDVILEQVKSYKVSIEKNKEHLISCQKAQTIIQLVALQTQELLEFRLNELASLAMTAIFREDAYELKLRFDIKRGRTEAAPLFVKDGKERRPMYGTGFGIVDVASFALRPTLWSLEEPKKMNCFLFDEPFRHLNSPTGELHKRAAKMIQEISSKLNIQIIIVTQNVDFINAGNKAFHIDQKNSKSFIKEEQCLKK